VVCFTLWRVLRSKGRAGLAFTVCLASWLPLASRNFSCLCYLAAFGGQKLVPCVACTMLWELNGAAVACMINPEHCVQGDSFFEATRFSLSTVLPSRLPSRFAIVRGFELNSTLSKYFSHWSFRKPEGSPSAKLNGGTRRMCPPLESMGEVWGDAVSG
jgi:hypothetical protein